MTRISLHIHTVQHAFGKIFGDPKSKNYHQQYGFSVIQRTIDVLIYETMHYFAVNVLLNKGINANELL